MSAFIYIEVGGDSKELHSRCREGFRRLLESCGFSGRMPRLVACGGRSQTFGDFKVAHSSAGSSSFVAMLLDSEDPIADIERTWEHLTKRDGWAKPNGADDEQVLLMVTCMETWIVSDHAVLRSHFKNFLQESGLPALNDLESRDREAVQNALVHATRNCKNAYAKGKRSFEIVGKLTPATLEKHLPSFRRLQRVLREKL